MRKKQKLAINTLADIEETNLRLELSKDTFHAQDLALGLLINFRPGATLRQLNNCRKINCCNGTNPSCKRNPSN